VFYVPFFLLSTSAIALNVTYLDPDYQVSGSFALPFDTIALAFDSVDNLYTVRRADFSSAPGNTIEIIKLDALTNYLTSSVYATYSGYGISGLEFDSAGNLFVSEIMSSDGVNFDSGRISRIDPSLNQSTVADLTEYRPTGISLDSAGNIYFPGRLESNPDFGNIYKIDSSGSPTEFISSFVGTGIAVDDSDNLFIASTSLSLPGQTSMAIHFYESESLNQSLFATLDT
jgi:hypothetical protein